jgi:hypothetical protein
MKKVLQPYETTPPSWQRSAAQRSQEKFVKICMYKIFYNHPIVVLDLFRPV